MRTVAIVQARMGSTRLPGKVLLDLHGQSVLSRVVRRLSRAKLITEVAIATTKSPADYATVSEAERLGIPCFRGSEQDVLSRYVNAAEKLNADVVVRITSDCPLIDPEVVDQVVQEFFATRVDLSCNDVEHGFPRGLDVEVFSRAALRKAAQLADRQYQREHVTPLFYERQDLFKTGVVHSEKNFSCYRWTLDTPADLQLIRAVYGHFAGRDEFSWREVVALMEESPEIVRLNAHVVQKRVHGAAAT